MTIQSVRSGLILLVVVAVLLAGCAGDTGTGDGTPTETATPTTDQPESTADGGQDDTSTPTRTAAETAMSTATATRAPDEAATSTSTPVDTEPPEETATADVTPTPSATATATPSGNADSGSFVGSNHAAALREAGSYTVTFRFEGVSDGSANTVVSGTEEVDLETGERYSTMTSESGEGTFSFEYYLPPDSNKAYQRVSGQTREVSESQALFFNFSDPGTGESSEEWPDFGEAGSGETTLGPATKYAVDSVEDLPESTTEEFDSVESVNFVVWVDDDTGLIAKYDYDLTYVEDGEENTVRVEFEITDLGSTTIEEPDWAP